MLICNAVKIVFERRKEIGETVFRSEANSIFYSETLITNYLYITI